MAASTADSAWKDKAARKRDFEASKIPQEWALAPAFLTGNEHSDLNVMDIPAQCGILSPAELEITERYSAISLAKAVQSGALSAAAVALAFCKRAAIAQQVTNCLTETFFDDAIKRGHYLDGFLAENKRPVGPLHGVPISLKDMINYKGIPSTLGLVSFLDHPPAAQNCPLVEILLDLVSKAMGRGIESTWQLRGVSIHLLFSLTFETCADSLHLTLRGQSSTVKPTSRRP